MLSQKELLVTNAGIRGRIVYDPFENPTPDISLNVIDGELQPMIEPELLKKRETLQMFQTKIYAFPDRIILEGRIQSQIVIPNFAQVSQAFRQPAHSDP